jgi:hypothetical protein
MAPVGSRVTLRGLVARPELNGARGSVTAAGAPGRLLVALDDAAAGAVPLAIKAENMQADSADVQAGAEQGKLVREHGMTLSNLLDFFVCSASAIVGERVPLTTTPEVNALRNSGPTELQRIALLTGKVYSYWFRAPAGAGVLSSVRQYLKDNAEQSPEEPLLHCFLRHVSPGGEAARWGAPGGRIHGRFWVMGERADGAGTTLLSEQPGGVSCVALGMANSIAGTLARGGLPLPLLMSLTLLPFMGRLVTDGIFLSADGKPPQHASGEQRAALLKRVADAERDGSLLFYLPASQTAVDGHDAAACGGGAACAACAARRRAHELCGQIGCGARTTADGAPLKLCSGCRAVSYCCTEHQHAAWREHKAACRATAAARAAPLTAAETALAARIAAVRTDGTMWVVRRLDTSEAENPEHTCFLLSQSGELMGHFNTVALVPTAAEVLAALERCVRQARVRPAMLALDCRETVAGVKRLLRSAGVEAGFYPAPSPEETAGINAVTAGWERPDEELDAQLRTRSLNARR